MSTFSERHGYQPPTPPITTRDQAPEWLRDFIVGLAQEAGISASHLRSMLCDLLLESPDRDNWSAQNISNEVFFLIRKAEWYQVYDLIEELFEFLQSPTQWDPNKSEHFVARLNEAFCRKGVGWQLKEGKIQVRGEESFEKSVQAAVEATAQTARAVAENEFREALHDLSRRPYPDIPGAVRHAMAALECVARDITGDQNATLGEIIKKHPGLIPSPLDQGLSKAWGFASDQARHVREGKSLHIRDAELLVGVAAIIATYLIKKSNEGPWLCLPKSL